MAIEGQFDQERNGNVEEPDPKDAPLASAAQAQPKDDLNEDERAAFDKIKQQLADAQREASQSAERARQAEEASYRYQQEAHQGHVSVRQAQLGQVERALESAAATMENLKREYRDAMQNGDYDKAAEAQADLAEAGARKVQLAQAKYQIENTPEPQPVARQAQGGDSFDAALQRYTPRTQTWIRQHPEVLRDDKLMKRAMGMHSIAESEGFIPDSDAYFDFMERNLGFKDDPPAPAAKTSRGGMATPPMHRGVSGSPRNASSMNVRDMTPKMLEAARISEMTPDEWLKNYQALVSAGEMEPLH